MITLCTFCTRLLVKWSCSVLYCCFMYGSFIFMLNSWWIECVCNTWLQPNFFQWDNSILPDWTWHDEHTHTRTIEPVLKIYTILIIYILKIYYCLPLESANRLESNFVVSLCLSTFKRGKKLGFVCVCHLMRLQRLRSETWWNRLKRFCNASCTQLWDHFISSSFSAFP